MDFHLSRLGSLTRQVRGVRTALERLVRLYEADLRSRGVNLAREDRPAEPGPVVDDDLPEHLYTDEELDLARSVAEAHQARGA